MQFCRERITWYHEENVLGNSSHALYGWESFRKDRTCRLVDRRTGVRRDLWRLSGCATGVAR